MPTDFKTFSDIRFFLKTPETTEAFTTPFTGEGAEEVYPTETFNNTSPINLISLAQNYQITFPTLLGAITFSNSSPTVEGASGIFADVEIGDFILYKTSAEDTGALKVLGKVANVVDDTEITLTKNSPISSGGGITYNGYLFHKNNNVSAFNPTENFYMAVKNSDYSSSGSHNGVLNINTAATTASSGVFAYGGGRVINPTYFVIQRISKEGIPDERETSTVNLMCTIKGISTLSEPSMFPTTTIPTDTIPYWSIYEVNPLGDTSESLKKDTVYRINIPGNSLPSAQVVANTSVPTGPGGDVILP